MQIYHTLTPAPAPQDSAVALGYFDGVHSGHRAVLGAAVTYAAQHGLTAAAFTFELPGNNSLKGGRILSLAQKHTRVAQLGIAQYWEPSFEEFRALSPEDFVRRVLVDCFHAKAVFCGDNFTFGAYAAGNVALLEQLCAPYGITVDVVPMAQYGGQTVSSTRIRAALEEGRLDDANAMLGKPYAIDWAVTHGKGIGSGKLGTYHQSELSGRGSAALHRRVPDTDSTGRAVAARRHRHRPPPHRGQQRQCRRHL